MNTKIRIMFMKIRTINEVVKNPDIFFPYPDTNCVVLRRLGVKTTIH